MSKFNFLKELRKEWEAEDGCLDWKVIVEKFEEFIRRLKEYCDRNDKGNGYITAVGLKKHINKLSGFEDERN